MSETQDQHEGADQAATYDVEAVQAKWQPVWDKLEPFRADDEVVRSGEREKRYALTMFPYPSGDLHMGHAEVTALHDVLARYWWQRGYEVLNPMGWDSFGLPAENAAIRNDAHPADYTYGNIDTQLESFKKYAVSFDWSRRFNTSDPEYYRWTQWLFLRLKEQGLAYRKNSPVNWCPNDQTVLANEQVVDGACERCGAAVTKRELTQWYFRTTAYAQELLDSLDDLQDDVVDQGRQRAAQLDRPVRGRPRRLRRRRVATEPITVYTTRPDTIFGTTFMVVAVDAALADELVTDERRAAFEAYREDVRKETEIERLSSDRPKTGVDLGVTARNPVTGEQIPVWAADYVLADYGTGAVMGVPGGDQRDWEFATVMGLPIIRTTQPPADFEGDAYSGEGPRSTRRRPATDAPLDINGLPVAEAKSSDDRLPGGRGTGPRHRQLPAARLAAVAPALLGCADPDHPLPGRRRGAGPRRPAARRAARAAWCRPEAQGRLAAGRGRGVGQRRVPEVRGTGQARHRHDGHVRRLVVVLPALLLPARPHPGVRLRPGQHVGPVRHLHRRRRARRAAPAVRPVLHQGAARTWGC